MWLCHCDIKMGRGTGMTNIPQPWEIIELFDSTNLTKEQVAAHFGVTTKHVKKTLMAQPEWND